MKITDHGIDDPNAKFVASPNTSGPFDPGPAFPLDKHRDRVLASDRSEDGAEEADVDVAERTGELVRTGVVTATQLNIRARPSAAADAVAPPLMEGTRVEILEEAQGWYPVQVRTRGWVLKNVRT
ncbi:MAG TPA: SH3 domain-containing protein [Deferrisomatales bacterium]|nr:SH3 domain-containing protein [Deferrisomatales bacterium]